MSSDTPDVETRLDRIESELGITTPHDDSDDTESEDEIESEDEERETVTFYSEGYTLYTDDVRVYRIEDLDVAYGFPEGVFEYVAVGDEQPEGSGTWTQKDILDELDAEHGVWFNDTEMYDDIDEYIVRDVDITPDTEFVVARGGSLQNDAPDSVVQKENDPTASSNSRFAPVGTDGAEWIRTQFSHHTASPESHQTEHEWILDHYGVGDSDDSDDTSDDGVESEDDEVELEEWRETFEDIFSHSDDTVVAHGTQPAVETDYEYLTSNEMRRAFDAGYRVQKIYTQHSSKGDDSVRAVFTRRDD